MTPYKNFLNLFFCRKLEETAFCNLIRDDLEVFNDLFYNVKSDIDNTITRKYDNMTDQEAEIEYNRIIKSSLETYERDFYNLAIIQGKHNTPEVIIRNFNFITITLVVGGITLLLRIKSY
jgi:hypothetical protein